jgi:Flp pilus assembly protein CpaB
MADQVQSGAEGPGELPEGGNKKLLVAALITGAVAMGLFYAYDTMKERQYTGDRVTVLKWTRDLNAGDEIAAADVAEAEVARSEFRTLGQVLTQTDRNLVSPGKRVNRRVSRDDYISYAQLVGGGQESPSANIQKGKLGISIAVDPYFTPGSLLQVGDRADLIGLISVAGKPPRAYMLIQNLRVVGIGGRGESPDEKLAASANRPNAAATMYRSFTVEVTEPVALKLAELLPRVQGKLWLAVRNPTDTDAKYDNVINGDVEKLLSTPFLGDQPQ